MSNRASQCLTLGLCLAAASCIPVEQVNKEGGADWIAVVGIQVEGIEASRLYSADTLDAFVVPPQPGWIVGFSTQQLVSSGIPAERLARTYVRFAEPESPQLPIPLSVRRYNGADALPRLTADWLLLPEDANSGLQLRINTRIVTPENLPGLLVHIGWDDRGYPLFRAEDEVHRLTEERLERIGPHNCLDEIVSLALYQGQYWATDGDLLCRGADLTNLERIEPPNADHGWDGIFHIDPRDRLYFVTRNGDIMGPAPELGPHQGRYLDRGPLQVINARNGAIVAAGDDWSFRKSGRAVQRALGIRPPFAEIGERLAFIREDGNAVVAPIPGSAGHIQIARGLSNRNFRSLTTMAGFAGGALLVDSNTLFWLSELGQATEFLDLGVFYNLTTLVAFRGSAAAIWYQRSTTEHQITIFTQTRE